MLYMYRMLMRIFLVFATVLVSACGAFVASSPPVRQSRQTRARSHDDDEGWTRRSLILQMPAAVATAVLLPQVSVADVADGNTLPQGVLQFNRVIRLKKNLKALRKRVAEGSAEMDKEEWDNVGVFLRTAYSNGDDMKVVAGSIRDATNKQRALDDIETMKKYAQAGDVPVSQQDASKFVPVADIMIELVNDFFDALVDVPAEL